MFKTPKHTLLRGAAALGALGLAACATSTPYTAAELNKGYGFTDQKIEDDRFRITFRGNAQTSRDAVETYLLLRSAELTLENGYDYFVVVEDETDKSTSYRGTSGFGGGFGPGFGFYGAGRAFPYYGFGYPWGAGFGGGFANDVDIRPRDRYTAIAYVKMGRGEKPGDELAAYDARQVEANLRSLVRQPEG